MLLMILLPNLQMGASGVVPETVGSLTSFVKVASLVGNGAIIQ